MFDDKLRAVENPTSDVVFAVSVPLDECEKLAFTPAPPRSDVSIPRPVPYVAVRLIHCAKLPAESVIPVPLLQDILAPHDSADGVVQDNIPFPAESVST